jgi:outer membrane protein
MKTESLRVLMLYPRQLASLVLTLTCVLLISSIAMAQTPATPQQQDQQATTKPLPESPPIPRRTIGLEPGKVVEWRMQDAILAALENNVDIEISKTDVRTAQWNLLLAQGVYDPTLSWGIGYAANSRPNIFQFSGTNAPTQTDNQYSYSTGVRQWIERTGGSYEITFNNLRTGSNTSNLLVNYSPGINFNITQPIFKNFQIDPRRNAIRVSKKQLDMSDAQFRQNVILIITNVMQAYWSLYVAIQNEEIARSALALAEKQMNDNKRQVEVGTLAPISITEAATVVEARRAGVYNSMNEVARAENTLKSLTVDGPNSDLWKARIDTISRFEVQNTPLPVDDAMKLAVQNRPELKRFNLQREMNQLDIEYFRNQAKPQIDFVANYGITGVGGRLDTTRTMPCGPNTGPDDQCVQPGFIGGYGTSLRNLFSNDFRGWDVGLRFTFPLRNRQAKASLANAREAEKQTDLIIRQQLQNIEVEVRNAVQTVETARQRIESTRKQREYAQEQFEGENKKFQAGLSPVYLVLQRQNELLQAQVAESSAIAEYAQATANLQRVIATTDVENNIQIPDPKQPMK